MAITETARSLLSCFNAQHGLVCWYRCDDHATLRYAAEDAYNQPVNLVGNAEADKIHVKLVCAASG